MPVVMKPVFGLLACGLLVLTGGVRASRSHEPTCTSKFDYDYKMLNKLIDLERQQKELQAAIQEQQRVLSDLSAQRHNYGSTYTLWGKKICPGNGSTLVYTGYMASGHHNEHGSGSNFVCLTEQPEWDYFEDKVTSGGKIYSTEYQFWEHRSTGASKFLGQNVHNKNAPCAVCHVTRGSCAMMPGRTTCFGGWTKEYSGYLVSGNKSHKRGSEFVCLDRRPDVVDGNQSNDDESLLYFVEGDCGKGLPCPPYVNGREITCVVCSL